MPQSLRDARHNSFPDSSMELIQSNLSNGPIYFNCLTNLTAGLHKPNVIKATILLQGLNMEEDSEPCALYRTQYKIINTFAPNAKVF